jgi:YggT family protein
MSYLTMPAQQERNTMLALYNFILWLSYVLYIALIGRFIMSWIDQQQRMFLTRLFHELTEPVLGPIRRIVPPMGMFDLSPIIALLLLQVLQRVVAGLVS